MDATEIIVDARGHRCPVPTLKLRRAMAAAPAGARLTLIADDPMAKIDVPHFAAEVGALLVQITELEGVLTFSIAKSIATDKVTARRLTSGAPPG
jgi:tRNA 2-thiouridine synthesizing protein A